MARKIFWNGYTIAKETYSWILYLIFAVYIGYITVTTTVTSARTFYLVVGLIILSGCLYYEYLKRLYGKMIQALTIDTDIQTGKLYKEKLTDRDVFHGFKHSIILFETLLLLDEGKYHQCLQQMETHQKFFKSSVDYLFVYYHNQLLCNYYLNKTEAGLEVATKILQIKKMNQKRYSPLFSWNEIQGIIYGLQGRNQKAVEELKKTNQSVMNTREKAHLQMLLAYCYRELGDTKSFGKHRKEATALAPTFRFEKVKNNEKIAS